MAENVDITMLARLCQDTLVETKAIRRDLAAVQGLAVRTVEALNKMAEHNEARFAAIDTRFAEIDARFSQIDGRFGVIDTRFAAVDTRFAAVDARLRGIDQRIGDLKGEVQLTIKSELMTTLGNFEARMVELLESRFARSD
jgi:hypothetical protein